MIGDWQLEVYNGEFKGEIEALLDLCKHIEEEHGIMKEEFKEHSKSPVQLELNLWL